MTTAQAAVAIAATLLCWTPGAAAQTVPVTVVSIYDGDTVTVMARPWLDMEIRTGVRIRGVNTPEIRSRCATAEARSFERRKAREARSQLAELLDGAVVEIQNLGHDRYPRRVVADGPG